MEDSWKPGTDLILQCLNQAYILFLLCMQDLPLGDGLAEILVEGNGKAASFSGQQYEDQEQACELSYWNLQLFQFGCKYFPSSAKFSNCYSFFSLVMFNTDANINKP